MIFIYCTQRDWKWAEAKIKAKGPYTVVSPVKPEVEHSATQVIIVGNRPSIKSLFAGLVPVRVITKPTKAP